MHQRTTLSVSPALARRILAATSVPALVCLAGCGEAHNLGEDAPAAAGESTCQVDVSSSGSVFALNQADVDALRGCRELPGTLYVRVPEEEQETFSLAALAELEAVDGLLSIAGPLRSLAGLESLERVASLELDHLRVPDLTPLGNTRAVQRGTNDARSRGTISIVECDELVDLSGLENLTTWSSLSVTGLDNLVTLRGLQAPPLVEDIAIQQTPRLADASALASVERVEALLLAGTAVADLDGFALEKAQYITLYENDALSDLDGLGDLRTVNGLTLEGNDALLRIELPSLEDYAAISIRGNAALRAVPHYPANGGGWSQPLESIESGYVRPVRMLFEVADNPQLESIVLPTQFTDIEQIAIYRNSSLTTLDMGDLSRSGNVWIQDNAVLGAVAAPWLARVDELSIVNNPALSVAPFANVRTFAREVSGNLDELAP